LPQVKNGPINAPLKEEFEEVKLDDELNDLPFNPYLNENKKNV